MIPYILIYLIGCVVAYVRLKKKARTHFREWTVAEWTVSDRKIAIYLSLLSWITATIGVALVSDADNDKPAKW